MHPQKKAFLFRKTCPECKKEFTCSEYCGEKAAKEISRLVFYCETCTPIVVEREKKEREEAKEKQKQELIAANPEGEFEIKKALL